MSQTYLQRKSIVEGILTAEKANAGKGKTLEDLAGKVLDALDHTTEKVR